jgi:phage tail sheath gpL-like
MGLMVLKINATDMSNTQLISLFPTSQGAQANLQAIDNYLVGVNGGENRADIDALYGAVQATATMTSTGAATANDTFSLANVVFTAKASGATGNEFNLSATVGTQAANIAAAINASPDLAGIVTATSLAGVVTITAVMPGLTGNGIQFSEDLDNVTITQFAGGTNGTAVDIDLS